MKCLNLSAGRTRNRLMDLAHRAGVLAANAAATTMAVGLSEAIDLSHSYIMVAGVGGGPPDKITIGTAAWTDWVVNGDLVTELDVREMPPDWRYPKAYLGCSHPWCPDGFRAGNEVFHLDPTMTGCLSRWLPGCPRDP